MYESISLQIIFAVWSYFVCTSALALRVATRSDLGTSGRSVPFLLTMGSGRGDVSGSQSKQINSNCMAHVGLTYISSQISARERTQPEVSHQP